MDDQATGGRWSSREAEEHINVLELRVILFGLQSLCKVDHQHIRIMTDNTTALAYVKHQGGVRSENCSELAYQIWNWAESRSNWLAIAHILGVENVLADYKSRNFSDNLEWSLSTGLFKRIVNCFWEAGDRSLCF